jgi:hypothetical protein
MFTWGSKLFLGLGTAFLVAALVYGIVTGGDLGVLTVGWWGGVGEHLGYGVLLGVALALLLAGVVLVWIRDADAEDVTVLAGTEQLPRAMPPLSRNYWGAVAGFGVGCVLLGLSVSEIFLLVGLVLLIVAAAEWLILDWADQATGDPVANNTIRNRIMLPLEIPVFGALAIGVFALGVSRVFLAVPAMGAVAIASVLATVIFGLAVAFAYRPQWFRPQLVSGLLAGLAVLVLVGGVVGAAVGPREFKDYRRLPGEPAYGHGGDAEGE